MRPLVLVLALLAPAAVAAAEPAPVSAEARAQAREHSERGRRLYELGAYDQAITAYREAYLILPSPGVLFNIGQAYRLKGDCAAAASAYRSFLRTEPTGPARRLAATQLAGMERCAAEAPPPARPSRGGALRGAGLAAGVGGSVLLGAGTYFFIDARRASDQVERHYREGGRWDTIAATDARGRRAADFALAFGASGGAALLTGTVLYVMGRRADRAHEPRVWIAPASSSTQVGVSWAW